MSPSFICFENDRFTGLNREGKILCTQQFLPSINLVLLHLLDERLHLLRGILDYNRLIFNVFFHISRHFCKYNNSF